MKGSYAADGPIGPTMLPTAGVVAFRTGMAEQAGAGARRTAAPPVVPFNLTPEEHFAAALQVQVDGLDFPSPVDVDIAYVANLMADLGQGVVRFRQEALDCFLGICARLEGVTQYIRSSQTPVLAAVNPKVHLAVIALLIAMMQWPDTSFCSGLHSGFPAEPCGIWPNRKIPRLEDHSCARIVVYQSAQGRLAFRQYHSMLFGLPLAAFNRLPFFCQALLRRMLGLMASFYYNDCTLQDWEPFAADKRQSPSFKGDFLGMIHDLSAAHLVGKIQLWIRHDKIQDFIRTARRDRLLHPGTAAKKFGCVTFLDQAAFARAGLNAIKD